MIGVPSTSSHRTLLTISPLLIPPKQEVHNVLNEVVIDRGAFPGPAVLDVFVDRNYVTTGRWQWCGKVQVWSTRCGVWQCVCGCDRACV